MLARASREPDGCARDVCQGGEARPKRVHKITLLAETVNTLVSKFDRNEEAHLALLEYSLTVINQRINLEYNQNHDDRLGGTTPGVWTVEGLRSNITSDGAKRYEMEAMQAVLAESLILGGILPADTSLLQSPYVRCCRSPWCYYHTTAAAQ